jgi:hypothetical protein
VEAIGVDETSRFTPGMLADDAGGAAPLKESLLGSLGAIPAVDSKGGNGDSERNAQ